MAENTLKMRGIVSAVMIILLVFVLLTGLLLYAVPLGKLSDLPFFDIYISMIRPFHILCGLLLVPFLLAHLYFNHGVLLTELKSLKK